MTTVRQNIVVFSGAGISRACGIPTYRDTDGLWKQYDARELATPEAFDANPQRVLDFYNYRRKSVAEAKPSHAHIILARLEAFHDVTIITQNIDDLHERAGSSTVIHLHGELRKITSSKNRLDPTCIKERPLTEPILIGDLAADGSQQRPAVVWFGEYLTNMTDVIKIVRDADIFLVVGTSLTVSPASTLVGYAHHEIPKYLIDPSDKIHIPQGYTHIKEEADVGIDLFVDDLKQILESDWRLIQR